MARVKSKEYVTVHKGDFIAGFNSKGTYNFFEDVE